jgi:hypothetical protein
MKTAYGWFFLLFLSLKTTHGCFSFCLLKPEDNIWMFFPIYLSLKTTHGCFFFPFS